MLHSPLYRGLEELAFIKAQIRTVLFSSIHLVSAAKVTNGSGQSKQSHGWGQFTSSVPLYQPHPRLGALHDAGKPYRSTPLSLPSFIPSIFSDLQEALALSQSSSGRWAPNGWTCPEFGVGDLHAGPRRPASTLPPAGLGTALRTGR